MNGNGWLGWISMLVIHTLCANRAYIYRTTNLWPNYTEK